MVTAYAPSEQIEVHNVLVSTVAALECPEILIAGSTAEGEGSLLIAENQTTHTRFPASVTACQVSETWEPARNCSLISKRRRWAWEVRVNFDVPVLTDRALEALNESHVVAAGVVLRMTRAEHTFRPINSPEQGTSLRLTFESISNR